MAGIGGARRQDVDRRKQIRVVATQLFEEQGYHMTTIDNISEAVSLNKGTLYYYYNSKASLLFDILLEAGDITVAHLKSLPANLAPDEVIRRVVMDSAQQVGDNLSVTAVYFQEYPFMAKWFDKQQLSALRSREREVEYALRRAIEAGIEDGTFAAVDPVVATNCVLSIITSLHRWYRPDRGKSRDVAGDIAEQVLRSLRPDHVGDGREASTCIRSVAVER